MPATLDSRSRTFDTDASSAESASALVQATAPWLFTDAHSARDLQPALTNPPGIQFRIRETPNDSVTP